MRLILDSNWKYKVAFDNLLYRDLKRHEFFLKNGERKIMSAQIDFFRTYFSVQQVIDSLKYIKSAEQFESFKKAVNKRITQIIFCPKELVALYEEKLNDIKNNSYHSFVEGILKYAVKSGAIPPTENIYKIMFGSFYKKVVKQTLKYAKRKVEPYTSHKISNAEMINILDSLKQNIGHNFNLQGIWGKFDASVTYNTLSNLEQGYGKWQSKNFTNLKDTFVINTNHGNITNKQLEHSYYLNVYPGYGHFYNSVITDDFKNRFDAGATFLINGWATFSAWHIKSSGYTQKSKLIYDKIVSFMLGKPTKKNLDQLYFYLLSLFDRQKAIKFFYYITQFPMLFESYILGAHATEFLIDSNYALNPNDYLKKLKTENIGDYFISYFEENKKRLKGAK